MPEIDHQLKSVKIFNSLIYSFNVEFKYLAMEGRVISLYTCFSFRVYIQLKIIKKIPKLQYQTLKTRLGQAWLPMANDSPRWSHWSS